MASKRSTGGPQHYATLTNNSITGKLKNMSRKQTNRPATIGYPTENTWKRHKGDTYGTWIKGK